jgi:hypothetical protein
MKKPSLTCCLLLLALFVNAAPVVHQEALDVAATFLKQSSVKEVTVPFEHLYVFNGDRCFVIVPDDDVVTPIIGYSRDHCFEAESMNDNLRGWLMRIDENIQAHRDAGNSPSDEVREQWDAVRNGLGLPVVNRSVVEPMVKTQWTQNTPFNDNCPAGCVTGCAATAMAQVMKYWEFPNHGIGSHSYVHPIYGTLAVSYNAATYDWDHMRKNYLSSTCSDVEKQAVATLMYHCGVSIDMNYGLDESSGDMTKMVSGLPEYFGYAPTIEWLYQRNYSDAQWKSLLKVELNAMRPMCYASGFPQDKSRYSFHAFVCDGYDEFDYFHFNWGWGGSGDGFYNVNSMFPVGETNFNYVVKGISPVFTVAAPENLTANVVQGQIQLTWTMPQESVSCNVYRDDELIATGVTASAYCDTTMSYGIHSYYLKAIGGNGDRSWKSDCVEVFYEFTAPSPIALGATLSGESLTLHWDMSSLMYDTLAYGTGPYLSSYGYSPAYPNPTFWGQRYPAEKLKLYGGYDIKSVSLYVTQLGSYTLNICRGDDKGVTEVMAQQTFEITETGWCDLVLDTPYPLEFTRDVWIVMNTPSGMYWVMAACEYDGPGVDDAAFYTTEMSDSFLMHGMGHSWMMKVMIEDGLTYRVTRNDELLANGWHGRAFVDQNIAAGEWNYKVWSSYQGVDCDEPVSYTISLANIEVASSDLEAGTVQGGGLAEVGSTATVIAYPNENYVFLFWEESGVEISSESQYTFTVEGSRNLVAIFAPKYHTIHATATLGGTITPSGDITVERGVDITFTMTPDTDCSVLQVSVDGNDVGGLQSYTFNNVTEDHTIHVQFKGYGVGEDVAEVRIVPNPVKDELHVESPTLIRRFEITTVNGVTLENKKVDSCSLDCHLGDYANGIYFLRLFTDEGVITKKIVVGE